MKFILGLLLAGALWTESAFADPNTEERRYAALSLIGDSITVVTYRSSTGSNLDSNLQRSFPVPGSRIDKMVLLAIDKSLGQINHEANTVLLVLDPATIKSESENLLDGQRFNPGKTLDQALKQQPVTHLLLVTKYRADAKIRILDGDEGSGQLEGVGFYIDRRMRMVHTDTGEEARGFLGPYTYFKVSLIDLATSTVMGQQLVTSGDAHVAFGDEDNTDPWNALSADQKSNAINSLIKRGISDAVPALVKADGDTK